MSYSNLTKKQENAKSDKSFCINLSVDNKDSHLGTYLFEVYPKMSLLFLKIQVEKELGIDISCQKWIFTQGFAHNDDLTLYEYGVFPNSPVFLYIESNKEPKIANETHSKMQNKKLNIYSSSSKFENSIVATKLKAETSQCNLMSEQPNRNIQGQSSIHKKVVIGSGINLPGTYPEQKEVNTDVNWIYPDIDDAKLESNKKCVKSQSSNAAVSVLEQKSNKPTNVALTENTCKQILKREILKEKIKLAKKIAPKHAPEERINQKTKFSISNSLENNFCKVNLKEKVTATEQFDTICNTALLPSRPNNIDTNIDLKEESTINVFSEKNLKSEIGAAKLVDIEDDLKSKVETLIYGSHASVNINILNTNETNHEDCAAANQDLIFEIIDKTTKIADKIGDIDKTLIKEPNQSTVTHLTLEDFHKPFTYFNLSSSSITSENADDSFSEKSTSTIETASQDANDQNSSETIIEHCSNLEKNELAENFQALLEFENLNLVRNISEFSCPVCFCEVDTREGVVLHECLHMFCMDCLGKTVEHAEEALVKCPFRDETYSCESHLQQREIKALVSDDIYERYLQRSINTAESLAEKSFHCKTPNCKGWCMFEENIVIFHCPVCSHYNCMNCNAIHEGLNCKGYQDKLKKQAYINQDSEKTLSLLNKMVEEGKAMKCPKCDLFLMKRWGCDWLKCSICQTEICWITKGPRWGPSGQGDTSGGCKCGVNGIKCHPSCTYCH